MMMTETMLINTVIAAEPGWKLAGFVERGSDGDACFWHSDVVVWQIKIIRDEGEEGHFVKPITTNGVNVTTLDYEWALRRPDGIYLWAREIELGTKTQAVEQLQKFVDANRAKKKKTA
jgi:hypothetical protein